jgi:IclR family acetate operon transcriptional repressor
MANGDREARDMAESQPKANGSAPGGVQSVERALDLLELLAQASDWVSISELSAATGQPVGTVHRLLMTLIARGYAARDGQTRRYALGPAVRRLAGADLQAPNWDVVAAPFLRELVALSGETANLAALERDRAIYVAQAQSSRMVRMFTELGNRVPLHNTGCGKVLLAYQPDDVIRSIIAAAGLPARTQKTITDLDSLLAELQRIRQRGYAIDDEEEEEGVRCLAVPVRDPAGQVVAAMSISGPAGRLDNARMRTLIPQLQRVSAMLTAALIVPGSNGKDGEVPADHGRRGRSRPRVRLRGKAPADLAV